MEMEIPEKVDYLKEDPSIAGQEVALISFVEPQEKRLLKNRESFFATRFLKGFIEEFKQAHEFSLQNPDAELTDEIKEKLDISYDNIKSRYYDFQKFNLNQMDADFNKEYNQNKVPTVTGFKVRGVFPSQLVTSAKAKELQALEPAINVFCIPVGKWIPYCPLNDQEIESEYQLNELNELLGKKEDEHLKRELEFNQRAMEMKKKAEKEKLLSIEEGDEEKDEVKVEEIVDELDKAPVPTTESKKEEKPKKRGRPKKVANKRKVNKK